MNFCIPANASKHNNKNANINKLDVLLNLQLEGVITTLCPFPAILSDRPDSLALVKRLLDDSHLQTLRHLLAKMALGSGDGDKMDLTLPARYMSKYGCR